MAKEVKIALAIIVVGALGFVLYRTLNPRKTNKPQHTGLTDVELRKIENICETKYNTDSEVKSCVEAEILKMSKQQGVGRVTGKQF